MLIGCKKVVWIIALACSAIVAVSPSVSADGQAETRKVISRVSPVYPPLAQSARLNGAVKLLAVVAPDGTVKSVRTLGGSPMFVPSAEKAVKQWKYEASAKETIEPVALQFSSAE